MIRTLPFVALALTIPHIASAQNSDASEAEDRLTATDDYDQTIIVTGEKTPRTLIETASSVNVVTQDELDRLPGADTLTRIFEQTANVSTTGDDNNGPSIRGVDSSGILTSLEAFFGGSQPRTTVQVDGRQLSFNEFVFAGASAWDIERVEIFRGPQTTTQGRNAIAGAVFIETADPSYDQFEARARGIVGGDEERQLSGLVSGPIGSGDLAFRLSADFREEESFVERISAADVGLDIRAIESLNLRGKLGYHPSDLPGFEALLTLSHSDTQRPQTESVETPFFKAVRTTPNPSVFLTNGESAILDLSYDTGMGQVITNVSTISRSKVQRISPPGTGVALIEVTDFSNEFTASFGDDSNAFSALIGSYVAFLESDDELDLAAFGLGSGTFTEERETFGIFGELTVSPTPKLHFTGGLRYQWDAQDRNGGFGSVIPIDFDRSFDAILPRAEIAFDLSERARVGIMAERGFNPGGFTFNFDTFAPEIFARELVWNYEAFGRTRMLEGQLLLTANFFYSDFEDYQIATQTEIAPDFFANSFSNVRGARAIGAELGARLEVTDVLFLDVGVGILDTKLEQNSVAGALVEGNEFERAPAVTATMGASWRPFGGLEMGAFLRYSDGYESDAANIAVNRVDDYFVADLQISYTTGPVRLFAYATNLFDAEYAVRLFSNGTLANIGERRRVSAGVELAF